MTGPTGIPISAHQSNSVRLKALVPPPSLMSFEALSYLPMSMFAQPPAVSEALPTGMVRYRSGSMTGLLVRLRPRQTVGDVQFLVGAPRHLGRRGCSRGQGGDYATQYKRTLHDDPR